MIFLITDHRFNTGERRRLIHRDLALEAERLDFKEKQKRENSRPLKHNKLRGPYGQRK